MKVWQNIMVKAHAHSAGPFCWFAERTIEGLVLLAIAAVAALMLQGCGGACKTVYYRDSLRERPYFRVDYCPGKEPRVACDSTSRLPNAECK